MPASPDPGPLAARSFTLTGQPPALDHARLLLESLGATTVSQLALDDTRLHMSAAAWNGQAVVPVSRGPASADWARAGAMALTGPAERPPALAPGAPPSALAGALGVFELLTRARTGADALDLPGTSLLGERAALAGLSRRAPR